MWVHFFSFIFLCNIFSHFNNLIYYYHWPSLPLSLFVKNILSFIFIFIYGDIIKNLFLKGKCQYFFTIKSPLVKSVKILFFCLSIKERWANENNASIHQTQKKTKSFIILFLFSLYIYKTELLCFFYIISERFFFDKWVRKLRASYTHKKN